MGRYDKKVIDCFLKNQRQLFPEDVASTPEEAEDFLDMVFATVVTLKKTLLILRAVIPWRLRRSSRSATDAT